MSSGKVALESGTLKDSRYTILCHVGLQTVSPKIQEYAKNGNLNLMKNLWNIRLWIRITSLKQSYLWTLCESTSDPWEWSLESYSGVWTPASWGMLAINPPVCDGANLGVKRYYRDTLLASPALWRHPLSKEGILWCHKGFKTLPMPTTRKTFKRALLCFY